jgi:hypothetical protein
VETHTLKPLLYMLSLVVLLSGGVLLSRAADECAAAAANTRGVLDSEQVVGTNPFWQTTGRSLYPPDGQLSHFKTWRTVLDVPLYSATEYRLEYLAEVEQLLSQLSPRRRDAFLRALPEPTLGHTEESYQAALMPCFADERCTAWSLKTAHHALVYEIHSGLRLRDYEQIVEFGAGVGETARLIHDLGFDGQYVIYDLPEVAELSRFYLARYNVTFATHFSSIATERRTLFIATWSLSEVPLEYRNQILRHFRGSDFLIIFQERVFEYSNVPYFVFNFTRESGTYMRLLPITFHKGGGGNYYLLATAARPR